MKPNELTIQEAQYRQPWTVPYSRGVLDAQAQNVPHILASHNALHAAKTVGKLCAVFEDMDHSSSAPSAERVATIRAMSADLVTEALRFANLYGFDLATALLERIKEKNGVSL